MLSERSIPYGNDSRLARQILPPFIDNLPSGAWRFRSVPTAPSHTREIRFPSVEQQAA